MESTDKDVTDALPPPVDPGEGTVSRNVRWNVADLDRLERAAEVLSARERLNLTTADIIRRGALKEADAILSAA